MLKKWIIGWLLSLALASVCLAGQVFFEDFTGDLSEWAFKYGGAVVADAEAVGGQCLSAEGNGESLQYIATRTVSNITPGEKFGFSFRHRNNEGFSGTVIFTCLFRGEDGSLVDEERVLFNRRTSWTFQQMIFVVPEDAVRFDLSVRLVDISASNQVFVDAVRLVRIDSAEDFYLRSFSTVFDYWDWRDPFQERCMFGPLGGLLYDWKRAYLGETCFAATGDNGTNQYPLWITALTVQPGLRYRAAVHSRADDSLTGRKVAMLIYFFYDEEGDSIGQERLPMRGTVKWTEAETVVTPPEGTARMDVGFRLMKVASNETFYLDNLSFEILPSAALLTLENDPQKREMDLTLSTTSDILLEEIRSATIKVCNEAEKTVWENAVVAQEAVRVPTGDWEDGAYTLSGTVELADGRELSTEPSLFNIYNEREWIGNGLGLVAPNDPPPAPWSPLTSEGTVVQNWNNTFTFDKALQLSDLRFKDNPASSLFTNPMQIRLNGLVLADAIQLTVPVIESGRSRTRLSIQGSSSDLDLEMEASVEFDGMVTYTLAFTAKRAAKLNELRLNFALHDAAGLSHQDGTWSKSGFLDLLEENGWSASHFYPIVWMGNIERGLYWNCEAVYPAVKDHTNPWIHVSSNTAVEIELINEPLSLEEGETYVAKFALGVTPMRPETDLWRTLKYRTGEDSTADMFWVTPEYFSHFGFPAAEDPAKIDQYIEKKDHLDILMFYQSPTYGMESIPHWRYFKSQWEADPYRAYPASATWPYKLVKLDYTQTSWTDLYLQKLDEFMDRYPWGGIYYDCIGVADQMQGDRYTFPVFPLREFTMRIYNTQRLDRPDSFTMTHTGANFCSLATGFSDAILMGEQYRSGCMENDYILQFLSLKRFRYENCTRVGPARVFLPQYRETEKMESEAVAVSALGLVMTHNLLLYPSFINEEVIDRVMGRKHRFDVTQADFFPYWKPNPLGIRTDNDQVVVSYYRNSKGLLLTMLNASETAQEAALLAEVSRVMEACPGAKVSLYDPLTDQTTDWGFGQSTGIDPYMSKLVLVSSVNAWE